jgi:hypothetical protein
MPNFFLSHKRAKVADCVAGPWRMWIAPKSKRARRDLAQGLPESAQSLPGGGITGALGNEVFPRIGRVSRIGLRGPSR